MKFTSAVLFAIIGAATAAPSPQDNTKAVGDILKKLKRDPSGKGFAHVGSDNVVRTFDGNLNVVDSAPLETRSDKWARDPSAAVLDEIRRTTKRSQEQTSSPREYSALQGRQESCVSENCPNDEFCQGLSLYGYDCPTCLYVTASIGNCQSP